jgi:hypothetical protein
VKFGTADLYATALRFCEFGKNGLSESSTLFNIVDEILLVFYLSFSYNFEKLDRGDSYNKTGGVLQRNIQALSCKHCCSLTAISITYYECVFVALVIQHATRMRHTVICAYPAVLYFSTLSHKWHDLREKVIELNACVLIFSTTIG